MARDEYQAALTELRADVRAFGADVVEHLDRGLRALDEADETVAREVVAGDDAIDDRYLDLEGDCIDLLALEQPVATDLRTVVASFKILTDLERVADLGTNFAEYALSTVGGGDRERLGPVDVRAIGELAREQVVAALDAYADGNGAAARQVAARDDDVDAACQRASERVVRDLIEDGAGADAWSVERVMDDVSRLLLTVRDLERVGDHAVNIAARTLYVVESDPELI